MSPFLTKLQLLQCRIFKITKAKVVESRMWLVIFSIYVHVKFLKSSHLKLNFSLSPALLQPVFVVFYLPPQKNIKLIPLMKPLLRSLF